MKEKIQNKIDEYVMKILEKDEITEKEFEILKEERSRSSLEDTMFLLKEEITDLKTKKIDTEKAKEHEIEKLSSEDITEICKVDDINV